MKWPLFLQNRRGWQQLICCFVNGRGNSTNGFPESSAEKLIWSLGKNWPGLWGINLIEFSQCNHSYKALWFPRCDPLSLIHVKFILLLCFWCIQGKEWTECTVIGLSERCGYGSHHKPWHSPNYLLRWKILGVYPYSFFSHSPHFCHILLYPPYW